ncbi:MAG: hypothetical protein OEY63_00330 [Gemmatimonadota bacterium]|nr:hypothetical protein [Gemmatimonadota bacterium]
MPFALRVEGQRDFEVAAGGLTFRPIVPVVDGGASHYRKVGVPLS